MTILVVGGGSGGHITPNLAVANAIKELQPNVRIVYVGQRGEKLQDVIDKSNDLAAVRTIFAGKFRRYHGLGVLQFLNLKTLYFNIRDFFRVFLGFFEACSIILIEKPQIIFIKGGFVGVPVGFAAALFRVPLITHDTDVLPGLTNRLIARFAKVHAVSQQITADTYYKDGRAVLTGPIISSFYHPIKETDQKNAKEQLGLNTDTPVILITGGGLGARRLNRAAATALEHVIDQVQVIHITGRGNRDETALEYQKFLPKQTKKLILQEYTHEMHICSAAADIIITRAGATMLAEFAVQKKACIVVPNAELTGGHQLMNAQVLETLYAARIVHEAPQDTFPERLEHTLEVLLEDIPLRNKLADNLSKTVATNELAAEHIARLLLESAT